MTAEAVGRAGRGRRGGVAGPASAVVKVTGAEAAERLPAPSRGHHVEGVRRVGGQPGQRSVAAVGEPTSTSVAPASR